MVNSVPLTTKQFRRKALHLYIGLAQGAPSPTAVSVQGYEANKEAHLYLWTWTVQPK